MRWRAPLGGLVLLLVGCGGPEPRPNVVIVAVDTLRADRLPFYGSPRDTAPFLSELAEESVVFENAWSTSSWTLPAAVSALTSVHPFQHGVTNLIGLELEPGEEPQPVVQVPAKLETLAETLGASGYRSFGIVSNVILGSEIGFDRGFDRYVKLPDLDADAVNAIATEWRDEIQASEPFFLYVHYFDPHDPFHPREPWFDPEPSLNAWGWSEEFVGTAPDPADVEWFKTRLPSLPSDLAAKPAADYSAADMARYLAWAKSAYDSEIRFMDDRIRELFGLFSLDDAVVIFLADHGEEFYEHSHLTHGQNLYWETMRVPLMLRLPEKQRGGNGLRRIDRHVSTLDIVPTLRGLLGLPPSEQDQGHDLLEDGDQQPIYGILEGKSGQHALDEDLRSIIVGNHRLIMRSGGGAELYDLVQDPLEQRDLAPQLTNVVEQLRAEIERIEGAGRRYPRTTKIPPPPSEAMLEHLRGLGYVN